MTIFFQFCNFSSKIFQINGPPQPAGTLKFKPIPLLLPRPLVPPPFAALPLPLPLPLPLAVPVPISAMRALALRPGPTFSTAVD